MACGRAISKPKAGGEDHSSDHPRLTMDSSVSEGSRSMSQTNRLKGKSTRPLQGVGSHPAFPSATSARRRKCCRSVSPHLSCERFVRLRCCSGATVECLLRSTQYQLEAAADFLRTGGGLLLCLATGERTPAGKVY